MCYTDETHGIPALTEVDRLVLGLSATGLLTHEVADQLGVSPDEVRLHIERVKAELGAGSKFKAVVRALEMGVISLPGASARAGLA
jgi:LuxR family maltose regulon positive regulatory protein